MCSQAVSIRGGGVFTSGKYPRGGCVHKPLSITGWGVCVHKP